MLEGQSRRAATLLLEAAIRIAPGDTRDWGQAMLGELTYIEGPWAALAWALGGAGVLAKHALASLFIPARSGQAVTPNGGVFAKEVSMRFFTRNFLIGCGAGAAVALLVLNLWGRHYSNEYLFSLQPRLLRPELQQHLEDYISSQPNARLPDPWLPGLSSAPHDGWHLKSLAGKPVALGDFKGKAVFLDIWASWCGPCVNEMAGIKRLADSLKNENVAFLLAARDDEPHVREFLHKNPLDLPIYLASGAAPDMPDAPIPVTYILDRQGAVVSQHIGAAKWDTDSVRAFLRSLENR